VICNILGVRKGLNLPSYQLRAVLLNLDMIGQYDRFNETQDLPLVLSVA